jgi:2-oxoglutarate ferredoxin oxidoreductase subunit delta
MVQDIKSKGLIVAKGFVVIEQDRCKGCTLCLAACPQKVISVAGDVLNARGYHPAVLVDPNEKCTGCAICAVICPDVCITVYREDRSFERASTAA